jgi:O-methyltransferase involved in polyketide biosynthesis
MKENQASFTAIMVVYIRAYQTKHETSKIFGDFLAHHLMPEGKITD